MDLAVQPVNWMYRQGLCIMLRWRHPLECRLHAPLSTNPLAPWLAAHDVAENLRLRCRSAFDFDAPLGIYSGAPSLHDRFAC